MSRERADIHPLAEEAAHWLLELEEPGPRVLRGFAAWLETSPRHVEEFLLAAAVWKEFDQLDTERGWDIQHLIEDARKNVRPLGAPKSQGLNLPSVSQSGSRWGKRLSMAGTLAAAILAALAFWLLHDGGPRAYATARGEQRAFKLEDGSVLYLNTQSRVEVSFSSDTRRVRLLEGEAMFTVEHDATRPFRVTAGAAVIQAIGTRFNVYRGPAGTTVSVVEGVVQISRRQEPAAQPDPRPAPKREGSGSLDHRIRDETRAARVSAGEQARVSSAGEIEKHTVPELAQLVAWRERRLVFRGDSLDGVATEFNRYNTLQIRVLGDAARQKRITGVFDADDVRSLVSFLERDPVLSVTERRDEVIVQER